MKVIRFEAALVRIYYNRGEDVSKQWSIDFGAGTPEISAQDIQICSVVEGRTRLLDGDATGANGADRIHPRAWFETIMRTIVELDGSVIVIRPLNGT